MSLIRVEKYHDNEPAYFNGYQNCIICTEMRNGKIWEKHMHDVFEKYVNKDSIVIEGGCHIGTHTIKLGKLAKHVHAFEPLPSSRDKLMDNIEMNELNNVTVHSEGLSDSHDKVCFEWTAPGNPGFSGLINNPVSKPSYVPSLSEKIEVQLVTIDSLNFDKVDFIKLDIEGYEELAIKGAINTIKKFKPIITLESWALGHGRVDFEFTKDKFSNLLDLGYTITYIQGPDYLFLPIV